MEPLALIGQAGVIRMEHVKVSPKNDIWAVFIKRTNEQDILTQRRTLLAVVTLGCFPLEVMIAVYCDVFLFWCFRVRISLDISWITGKARQRLLCFHSSRIARKGVSKKTVGVSYQMTSGWLVVDLSWYHERSFLGSGFRHFPGIFALKLEEDSSHLGLIFFKWVGWKRSTTHGNLWVPLQCNFSQETNFLTTIIP